VKWIKPAEGRFKCNIDASISQLSNRVGIWVCIRDDTGTFVLAKTEWFTLVCEVHVGEALGLLSTLEWVHQLHLGPIEFEPDTKKVVDSFSFASQDVLEHIVCIMWIKKYIFTCQLSNFAYLWGDVKPLIL